MRHLLVLAAVAGLALARPETYREKEDFQFSRSSTDEGSKSGYYGAQRGNMGGNYERAHNMDHLAQNQMSGLVRSVEGELGEGAKQTTGSVYSAANSRGIYGSGHYDLSNLEGRNFQEGESQGSQSHSSLTSHHGSAHKGQFSSTNQDRYGSQLQNTGYSNSNSHDSRYGGYSSAGNSEQALYSNGHQHASSNLQSGRTYDDINSGFSSQNSGYYSQAAGYQGSGIYDQSRLTHNSDGYGSNIHSRVVSGTPVRIVIRPGTRVSVPVAAQTYDASQSTFDQNAINSETDVFNNNDQHVVLKPRTKNYESSYSYRKEWEKHDSKPVSGVVIPLAIPTENPFPTNSELYEDTQAQTSGQQRQSTNGIASHSHHSSHSGYNVNSASSSQSRQTDYNAQLHSSGAHGGSSAYNGLSDGMYIGGTNANNRKVTSGAYTGSSNSASNLNQIEDSHTQPKSYQSSYSYHKSWERQGDPYIIKPSTNGLYDGQASERLIATSNQGAYSNSHQHGSHQSYSDHSHSHSDADCDENGHIRVARSPYSHHHSAPIPATDADLQQQWDSRYSEDLGQQTLTKWDNIETLGQQTQNTWDQTVQQTENKRSKLQNEGQQTQTLWGQQETQNKWDNTQDFGQQSQSQWDQHDDGQQTQNTWDKLDIEPQRQTELGQQTQDIWTTLETNPSANEASITEQKPSGFDNSRQDYGINTGHQSNKNTFEIAESSKDQKSNTESYTVETSTNKTANHHAHTIWDEIKKEEIGQENEDTVESDLTQTADLGQQTQVSWGNINQNENSFNPWHQVTDDKVKVVLTNSEDSNTFFAMPNPHPWMYNQVYHHHHENRPDSNQYFTHSSSSSSFSGSHSHSWQQEHSTNMNSNSYDSNVHMHSSGSTSGSPLMGLWDKLDNIEKETIPSQANNRDKDIQYEGQQGTANVYGTQVQQNVFNSQNADHTEHAISNENNAQFEFHTTVKPSQPNYASLTTTTSPSTEAINKDDKVDDVGRGDIGPEDSSNEQSEPVHLKPSKTPEEIETLSLTKETEKTDKHGVVKVNKNTEDEGDLSVMSLDQQNHSQNKVLEENSRSQSAANFTTTNTQNTNYHHIVQNENTHYNKEEKQSRDFEQQSENQGPQNVDQQTFAHQFMDSKDNQTQNTDQQLVDFGQQSENIGAEQMKQQFETQNNGQSSFNQENSKHEAEELGQEHELFDQVSLSGWKPDENLNQQLELQNWGQANENLEQQSQSGWEENMEGQQVQTAWQEELQQHSQLSEPFEQPIEDLSQQVQTAWKPTEDLQQHSQLSEPFERPMEDLSQQVQTAWKPTEDLQQHSQLSEPFEQPMEDLSQQVQTAWKPTEDLQQHRQLAESFEQPMEDLSQQVQTARKPTEDLQHQHHVTDVLAPQADEDKENPPKNKETYNKQSEVVEELIVPKKVPVVNTPPETEPVTEKSGFWSKVGGKFTSAKDKVASWFSRN